ncbi:MAG: hypothetical protein L3J54_12445 [Draconibacterium sp.]|nr:hypothetical protein [Draconibacterium sp.]
MQNTLWKPSLFEFDKNTRNALGQQHLAAQFIALVGRYIVPKKPDSSNINMQFISDKEMLLGNKLKNGLQIGLQLSTMEIVILQSNGSTLKTIQLNNKTFEQVFGELKQVLIIEGVDISKIKTEQPYKLPTQWLSDSKFLTTNNTAFVQNSILRNNAEIIINELIAYFSDAIPVRIWPHHFDTGTFFTAGKNSEGKVTQTIGLGWAIPDEMVNEPYFYISFWSEKEVKNISNFAPLKIGNWLTPDWNGAVLTHSEIIDGTSVENQYLQVKQFYNSGIEQLMQILKKNR